jgi:hypothetical protein
MGGSGKAGGVDLPTHPISVAVHAAQHVLKDTQIKLPAHPSPPHPVSLLIPPAWVHTPGFRKALDTVVEGEEQGLWKLGVSNMDDFHSKIAEAVARLDGKRVTVSAWLGKAFEVIAPGMPIFMEACEFVQAALRAYVDAAVVQGKKIFMNGRFQPLEVTARFTAKRLKIRDARIRTPGQEVGVQYIDRGVLDFNHRGQALLSSREIKCRAAAKELPEQMAGRDDRLRKVADTPGTRIHFTVELKDGTTSEDSIAVEDLVLLSDAGAASLSKVSFQAGRYYAAKIAWDAASAPYIRVIIPCKTDLIRRILERLHRDPTWRLT